MRYAGTIIPETSMHYIGVKCDKLVEFTKIMATYVLKVLQ